MALEKKGSTVYANITDLPAISDLRNGDSFIVQTANGTRLFDYKSLLIPLSKTSFQTSYNEMMTNYQNSQSSINKIGESVINVTGLSSEKANLSDAVNQLNINVDSITMDQIPMGTIVTRFDEPAENNTGERQGYLPMNGQTVDKASYLNLYNYLLNLGLIEASMTDLFIMPKSEPITINFIGKDPKTAYYYIKY